MIEVLKYEEGKFVLPSVVDFIDYQSHAVIDIIMLAGTLYKKDQLLKYKDTELIIHKKLKDYPIQTEFKIENRLEIRKVRYFCNKI